MPLPLADLFVMALIGLLSCSLMEFGREPEPTDAFRNPELFELLNPGMLRWAQTACISSTGLLSLLKCLNGCFYLRAAAEKVVFSFCIGNLVRNCMSLAFSASKSSAFSSTSAAETTMSYVSARWFPSSALLSTTTDDASLKPVRRRFFLKSMEI